MSPSETALSSFASRWQAFRKATTLVVTFPLAESFARLRPAHFE